MRMDDIQQATDHIRNIARTETVHRDAVMATGIVDDPETGMKSVLEQQQEQRVDTRLMQEKCRKVDSRYILICFPCLSLQLWL